MLKIEIDGLKILNDLVKKFYSDFTSKTAFKKLAM